MAAVMPDVSRPPAEHSAEPKQPPAQPAQAYIHRVCVQCNNIFRVTADKFDAKQCPNCHKG
jgi:hypothetical protein